MSTNDFEFSLHARDQLQNRGISENLVLQALAKPLDIVEEDGLSVYHSVFKEDDRNILLRVYVNPDKNPPLIVTVYKTSKLKKYLL